MMLMMVIFAVMSAGLFYASRVSFVQEDIAILLGREIEGSGEGGKLPQIVFILFTFTSPLLLAAALGMFVSLLRWLERRRE